MDFDKHIVARFYPMIFIPNTKSIRKNALLPLHFAHSQLHFRKCSQRELSHVCVIHLCDVTHAGINTCVSYVTMCLCQLREQQKLNFP